MDNIIFYLIAIVLMGVAQMWVNSAYSKYAQVANDKNISGAEAAQRILDANDIHDVAIQAGAGGVLSDFYDPRNRIVNLSPDVYNGRSISSVAVAAHEIGHAIQHQQGYKAIAVRNNLLPIAQIGSSIGWYALLFGVLTDLTGLFYIGLIAVGAMLLFQLVTLPIELDASSRAKKQLVALNIVGSDEMSGVNTVLRAAAFTYIASFLATVFQVLRLVMMRSRRN